MRAAGSLTGRGWSAGRGVRYGVAGWLWAWPALATTVAPELPPSAPPVRQAAAAAGAPAASTAAADGDGDGVADSDDLCPDFAEDRDGVDDGDGCPEVSADADGDGVPDHQDACPQQPEDRDGFADHDGCPDPDNDLDGILDAQDACPGQAGSAEERGCPVRDRDQDGVADAVDRCPDLGGAPPDGCPPRVMVLRQGNKLELQQQFAFAPRRARMRTTRVNRDLLAQISDMMRANPSLVILVEGHTDALGRAAGNLRLSAARAEAVRWALVALGVAAERLQAAGYGAERPIAANSTVRGRGRNRRVELTIQPASAQAQATDP